MAHTPTHKSGFTLIEVAIALMILSIITVGGLTVATRNIQKEKRELTIERMDVVLKALENYVAAFGHLPCPASTTDDFASATFGIGEGTGTAGADNCTQEAVDIEYNAGADDVAVAGSVPVGTLGINPLYMFDGFNRRFSYIVDEDLTKGDILALEGDIQFVDAIGSGFSLIGDINITTWEGDTAGTGGFDPATQGAAVLLISHGKNGHGAIPPRGGTMISKTTGTLSGDEEDDNALDAATPMNGVFRQTPFNSGKVSMNDYFDDIIEYRTRSQLRD